MNDPQNAEDVRFHFGLSVAIAKDGLGALLLLNGAAAAALITLAGQAVGIF
jgi:hypothetical protein